jgi:hypothetical protein
MSTRRPTWCRRLLDLCRLGLERLAGDQVGDFVVVVIVVLGLGAVGALDLVALSELPQ